MKKSFLLDGSLFHAFLIPETAMEHESILIEDGMYLIQMDEETLRLLESSRHYDSVYDVFVRSTSYPLACVFCTNPKQDLEKLFGGEDVAGAIANMQGSLNSLLSDVTIFPERVSALMTSLSISINGAIRDPSDYISYRGHVAGRQLDLTRNLGLLGRKVFDLSFEYALDESNIEIFVHIYRDLRRIFRDESAGAKNLRASSDIAMRSRDGELINDDLSDIILLSAIDALDLNEDLAQKMNLQFTAFRQVRNNIAHGRRRSEEDSRLNLFTVWRNAFLVRLQDVKHSLK